MIGVIHFDRSTYLECTGVVTALLIEEKQLCGPVISVARTNPDAVIRPFFAMTKQTGGFDKIAHYIDLLEQCASDLKGPRQIAVLTTIETEYENIRAAWAWAITQCDRRRVAQAMESLGFFYEWQGRFQEGERLFAQAVATFTQSKDGAEQSILPQLLTWQATFHQILGHQDQASQCLRQALAYINNAGRTDHVAQQERAAILHGLGLVAYEAGDRLASGRLFAESLALYRTCNDRWGEAKVLLSVERIDRNLPELANPHQHRQATERSKALVLESLAIFRQSDDQANLSMALERLAAVFLTRGQAQEAREALTECLAIHRRLNMMNGAFIDALINLGIAHEYLGLYEQMHNQAQQALALAQAVGDVKGTHRACFLLSSAVLVQQRFDEVEHCFQAVTHLVRKEQAKSGLTILQLINCGLVSYRLGDLHRAQGQLDEALLIGLTIRSIRGSVHGLLLGALLLVEQGKLALAVELHALAMSYPFVANSRWCVDVAGRELSVIAATLPEDTLNDAQARGQAGDLWTTVAALLAELERTWTPQTSQN